MIIYIAGKYNAPTDGQRLFNTNRAIDFGIKVINKGNYAHIPHLTHYIEKQMDYNNEPPRDNAYWYEFDNKIIPKCDGLLMINKPGESVGADMEVALAKSLGLRIFYNVEDVPNEA
jgi:hypothetical protein